MENTIPKTDSYTTGNNFNLYYSAKDGVAKLLVLSMALQNGDWTGYAVYDLPELNIDSLDADVKSMSVTIDKGDGYLVRYSAKKTEFNEYAVSNKMYSYRINKLTKEEMKYTESSDGYEKVITEITDASQGVLFCKDIDSLKTFFSDLMKLKI